MPARKYSIANTNYRYGFNGKENDNDIENGAQDYGMRIYDGRLGRFLSVDPITQKYPELTPYQFASNRPIEGIDMDGLEFLTNFKSIQLKHFDAKVKLDLPTAPKIKEQEILKADMFGTGWIGPKSVVESNIAAVKQNYYNAVANNIISGPGGAAGYLMGGDKGSFYGAAIDGVALSFGGIPGESSAFPKAGSLGNISTSTTEIAPYEHSPVNIIWNAKPGWTKEQVGELYNKAQAISNNPEAKITIKNPMPRPENLRKKFINAGGIIAKDQHVDHITDLQLNGNNGADGRTNLGGLNGSVNTSTGSQTYQQIKNLPDNTRVSHVLVNPFSHK